MKGYGKMNLLFLICLLSGILFLFYYGIIVFYAGFGSAFAEFWLCAGLFLMVVAFVFRYMKYNEIRLPGSLKVLVYTIVTIGLCIFILLESAIIVSSRKEVEPGADYLIVLGAQVRGTTITKSLKKRLDKAIEYLSDNPDTITIVSGGKGSGEDITEAEAMSSYLIANGIAKERIMKEEQSVNTYQNIRFSKRLMNREDASVVIVTNSFHIFRATKIAKKQNLVNVQGLSAASDPVLLLNYYVREAAGVLKDFLVGNL